MSATLRNRPTWTQPGLAGTIGVSALKVTCACAPIVNKTADQGQDDNWDGPSTHEAPPFRDTKPMIRGKYKIGRHLGQRKISVRFGVQYQVSVPQETGPVTEVF